tara:strand:- start:1 stop:183 length:183 start_codon:yes stop_codon:yes gene_type:complete
MNNLPETTRRPINDKTFSVRITNTLTEELDRIAINENRTRANLIRHFIAKGVKEYRENPS